MRILYLSQLIPYPIDAGPKTRIYRVLQYLAEAGHQTTLVAFRREEDTLDNLNHLRQFCSEIRTVRMVRSRKRDAWQLVSSALTGQPFLIRRDATAAMYQLLQDLVTHQHFEVIHADQLWMAQYGLAAKGACDQDKLPLTVLDQHNAVYLIPERLASGSMNQLKRAFLRREARNLGRYELKMCAQFDRVVWVTEQDRAAIESLANGNGQFKEDPIIPICVDPQDTMPVSRSPKARRVTFLGGMHWPPNAEGINWFGKEVWPLIQQGCPDAVLTIIGKNPPGTLSTVQDCNVEAIGYVSDLIPYLTETAVFIVPLHAGGGMRVKILDAWCWGLPIVSTTIGAEGLCGRDGENLLLADNPQDFANAVISLLRNPILAERVAAAGRKTVETHYDWRKVYRAWDDIYEVPQ